MRNFKELKDNEKEEIAKELALQIVNRPPNPPAKDEAKEFIRIYNSIIDSFKED